MVQKSLDLKLARIHADPHGCKDFILADAKDADMALAIGAPGRRRKPTAANCAIAAWPSSATSSTQIVEQKLVDIMLMSASTSEVLTIHKRLFDNSPVTPAARANDTTDIHIIRGSKYPTAAVAAVPHRHARPHPVRPSRLQAGGTPPRRQPRPVQHHLQQRHGPRPRRPGGVQAVPPGGRAQGLPALPGGVRSESAGGGRGQPRSRRSSTTPSSARSAA